MSRWRLAVLLELAGREEVQARGELAAARVAEEGRRAERAEAAAALAAHRARVSVSDGARASDDRTSAARLRAEALHRAGLDALDARLAEALRERDAALAGSCRDGETRRQALAAARAAAGALERHREAWSAARARERARAEDAAADDLVSARPAGPS